jgi:hypothetical protein
VSCCVNSTQRLELRYLTRNPASNTPLLAKIKEKDKNNQKMQDCQVLLLPTRLLAKDQIVVIVVVAIMLVDHTSAVSVQKVNKSRMEQIEKNCK